MIYMYAKPSNQFEGFIVLELLPWAVKKVKQGFRYQFKSPNPENRKRLFNALILKTESEKITYHSPEHQYTADLPYITIGDVKLIPLLQTDDESGFTESFISHLRDEVTKPQGELAGCALLILHNSKLDTINNSSDNLAKYGSVWSNEHIKSALKRLIDEQDKGKDISEVLLDYQCDAIKQDSATLFGFEELYKAIVNDGDLRFDELYLLEDSLIHDFKQNPKQVRKRLDENRKLYKEIEHEVNHFPNQLDVKLANKFSSKFIKKQFPRGDSESWKKLEFETLRDEIKRNQKQTLELDKIELEGVKFFSKTKGSNKAQQREIHLIIECPVDKMALEFDMVWNGGDLENEHLSKPNQLLPVGSSYKVVSKGAKTSRTKVIVPFDGTPLFFTVGTEKRDKGSDKYKIHCLIVCEDMFNIEAIKNIFLLNPKKQIIRLLTNDSNLDVNASAYSTLELNQLNQCVSWEDTKAVDFKNLSEKENDVEFSIANGEHKLDFIVEGEVADISLSLPLIFDKERLKRLLKDDYYGEFNRDKLKIIIDNKEVSLVSIRQNLIRTEAGFVDERLLYVDELNGEKVTLSDLEQIDPALHLAYVALFNYYDERKSLPSLVSWGPVYREIVKELVDSYIAFLDKVKIDHVLTSEEKLVLKIGLITKKDEELIAPFHPLVLAYYLYLTNEIQDDFNFAKQNDNEPSFKYLPKVTLERMNPRGLIPYLYCQNNGFSHVNVVKENAFWLKAIPHERSQYDFVTALVEEKIEEFQEAFSDLFENHERCKLVLNSVNQGNCHELFMGVVNYFKNQLDDATYVHVNIYDRKLEMNAFDIFAESSNSDELKEFLGLTSKKFKDTADTIVELLRTRLTYSKFKNSEVSGGYEYAHISFFYNDEKVDCIPVNMEAKPSGIAADGLLGGEASESQNGSYHTAFGLHGIEYEKFIHLKVAKLFGSLIRPAREDNLPYSEKNAVALAVNENFRALLKQTCDSSIWTTIIDPRVTLEFFETQNEVVIHYSDQYTTSAGFDAITVSRHKDLFTTVLEQGLGAPISDVNAFNGDWLLKMLTASDTGKLGMEGEIGAFKFVTAMFHSPEITWVPLSVGEMVRVSKNIGLNILESELSAANAGLNGAMCDDILLVGLVNQQVCVMPVEVKTGSTPDYKHAIEQVKNLRTHLIQELNTTSLKGKLYRALFIRQLLAQVDKYRLYKVFPDGYFSEFLNERNDWLRGEYRLADLENYPKGIVIAHLSSDIIIVSVKLRQSRDGFRYHLFMMLLIFLKTLVVI